MSRITQMLRGTVETDADAVERLARNLFARDHPDRSWRSPGRRYGESAEEVERTLYRQFATARLMERARPPAFRGLSAGGGGASYGRA